VCCSRCRSPTRREPTERAAPTATGSHRQRQEQTNQGWSERTDPVGVGRVHICSQPPIRRAAIDARTRPGVGAWDASTSGLCRTVSGIQWPSRSRRKSAANRRDNRIGRHAPPIPSHLAGLEPWHAPTAHASMDSSSPRRRPRLPPGRVSVLLAQSAHTRRRPACRRPAGSRRAKRTAAAGAQLLRRHGGTVRPPFVRRGLGSRHTGRQYGSRDPVAAYRNTGTSLSWLLVDAGRRLPGDRQAGLAIHRCEPCVNRAPGSPFRSVALFAADSVNGFDNADERRLE